MAKRSGSLKTEQFDMDSLFDFNQSTTQPSPATGSASTSTPMTASQDWNALSPCDKHEERLHYNGPSHDYNLHKQQVGLPVGSVANLPPQSMFDDYGSGMGDMGFGWSSGIDLDTDMNMDFNNPHSAMPPMFFPPPTNNSPADAFVDPSNIGGGHEEPMSNVGRLWPGMHSQQAQQVQMQKAAQVHAVQQRQMKLQAQHAQYRQASNASQNHGSSQQSNGHAKRPSHASEPHVEESISRLLNQMRQNSTANDNADDDEDVLPHIARMKKDEEEMDEDERLLASEEGKKLSSKERRQLRNKVSARAFRSRRKEYIGQLEGDLAIKAQENTNLRNENAALMQENDRYRTLIETLLRHPAFTPFINDISKDPSVLGPPPQQQNQQQQSHQQQQAPPAQPPSQPPQQQSQHQQQAPQDSKPDFMNFDASQLQIPNQQPQRNERVGLAMIPENDFSKLNINGLNSMNFNGYSVNAYPVFDLPPGPDPANLLNDSTPCSYFAASDPDDLFARLDGAARRLRLAEESAR